VLHHIIITRIKCNVSQHNAHRCCVAATRFLMQVYFTKLRWLKSHSKQNPTKPRSSRSEMD
jgi:hypothetical protein